MYCSAGTTTVHDRSRRTTDRRRTGTRSSHGMVTVPTTGRSLGACSSSGAGSVSNSPPSRPSRPPTAGAIRPATCARSNIRTVRHATEAPSPTRTCAASSITRNGRRSRLRLRRGAAWPRSRWRAARSRHGSRDRAADVEARHVSRRHSRPPGPRLIPDTGVLARRGVAELICGLREAELRYPRGDRAEKRARSCVRDHDVAPVEHFGLRYEGQPRSRFGGGDRTRARHRCDRR